MSPTSQARSHKFDKKDERQRSKEITDRLKERALEELRSERFERAEQRAAELLEERADRRVSSDGAVLKFRFLFGEWLRQCRALDSRECSRMTRTRARVRWSSQKVRIGCWKRPVDTSSETRRE